MSAIWYYVKGAERVGPVTLEEVANLISDKQLIEESYLWKKGFANWEKLKNIEELQIYLNPNLIQEQEEEIVPELNEDFPKVMPKVEKQEEIFSWEIIDPDKSIFVIKIGADRGVSENEYGPFSLNKLQKLFSENRINGKTLIFSGGMKNWEFLAETPLYKKLTGDSPPKIEADDRRSADRKPFVAKMMFHDKKVLYEGICRDISIGGVQILVSGFPGKVGDRVSINVHPENSEYSFVAQAKIVRILEGESGFSLRFLDLGNEAQKAIGNYLERCDV